MIVVEGLLSQFRARICKPGIDFQPRRGAGATNLFVVPARQATGTQAGGIDTSESIPGLHKRSQTRAQQSRLQGKFTSEKERMLDINLIQFGYITRLLQWGGGVYLTCSNHFYLSSLRLEGGGPAPCALTTLRPCNTDRIDTCPPPHCHPSFVSGCVLGGQNTRLIIQVRLAAIC